MGKTLRFSSIFVMILLLFFAKIFIISANAAASFVGSDRDYHEADDQLTLEASKTFLRQLFDKYGDIRASAAGSSGGGGGNRMTTEVPSAMLMTFEGFEHLLESLGLGNVHIPDHGVNDHRRSSDYSGRFRRMHDHDEFGGHRSRKGGTVDDAFETQSARDGSQDNNDQHRQKSSSRVSNNERRKRSKPGKTPRRNGTNVVHEVSVRQNQTLNFSRIPREVDRQSKSKISEGVIVISKCMSAVEILKTYHIHHRVRHSDDNHIEYKSQRATTHGKGHGADDTVDIPDFISQDDFLAICPSIIYQLDQRTCYDDRRGRHSLSSSPPPVSCTTEANGVSQNCSNSLADISDTKHDLNDSDSLLVFGVPAKIWGFATLSIVVISLTGLVIVAIIPLMGSGERNYFNGVLQLLIALAVGTLTGDALLHLLPHALFPHESHDENESHEALDDHDEKTRSLVMHSLTVLIGIYSFFIVERLLSICNRIRRPESDTNSSLKIRHAATDQVGQKLSSHNNNRLSEVFEMSLHDYTSVRRSGSANSPSYDENRNRELVELLQHPNDAVHSQSNTEVEADNDVPATTEGDHTNRRIGCKRSQDSDLPEKSAGSTDVHRRDKQHHGHSHDEMPSNVASVAWMVIMGDGLHNFTDGLAIGASFVGGGLAGGLGTTVAVFCHELPHELGDFALLLNAGMSVKQALFYNLVSSVLSIVGLIVGVLIGNIGSASSWIFGLTAGIFIYISLVDMIPQMTKVEQNETDSHQRSVKRDFIYLILHTLGIASGLAIMTFIALFEDRIQLIAGEVEHQ